MEHIANGSLRNLISTKGSFNDDEAAEIIGGLLTAVKHVHSKNYVHRDLKPENVLIGDSTEGFLGAIRLADFGLSASFRISTAHSLDERMGTLIYMAPEQTKH